MYASRFIKPKVLDFKIALRRASYFFTVEYFKAFWLAAGVLMIISIIQEELGGNYNWLCVLGDDYGNPSFLQQRIFGVSFSFPIVLVGGFLGPVAGAWKFLKEMFA